MIYNALVVAAPLLLMQFTLESVEGHRKRQSCPYAKSQALCIVHRRVHNRGKSKKNDPLNALAIAAPLRFIQFTVESVEGHLSEQFYGYINSQAPLPVLRLVQNCRTYVETRK
jgi:hypothetical protein